MTFHHKHPLSNYDPIPQDKKVEYSKQQASEDLANMLIEKYSYFKIDDDGNV